MGNSTEFLEGVAVRLEGVPARLEGVTGKGTAKSRTARFAGDFEGDLEKGVGEEGVARMEADDGDLGEDEARRRVRVEGCFATGKGGRVTIGMGGTSRASLCSYREGQ